MEEAGPILSPTGQRKMPMQILLSTLADADHGEGTPNAIATLQQPCREKDLLGLFLVAKQGTH